MSQELQQHERRDTTTGLSGFKKKPVPTGVPVADLIRELDQVRGGVRVMHGARDMEVPIAGITVAEARSQFKSLFNIADDATAFVDGLQVGENCILRDRSTLEFLRESGQKGT